MKIKFAQSQFGCFRARLIGIMFGFSLSGCWQSIAQKAEDTNPSYQRQTIHPELAELPLNFPEWEEGEPLTINQRETTLSPEIQARLDRFIRFRGNPIAAVMLVSVETGEILAMSQGRPPEDWEGKTHTALHSGFPAASLFKTVVSAAAFEIADMNPDEPIGLVGGCARVHARGNWMRFDVKGPRHSLSLKRAYGSSCNGFFAKLAVNEIGFGPILNFSRRFGWTGQQINADFKLTPSPIREPDPKASSVHTIGKFAAGFGYVGISAAHAAWQTLAIANDGIPKPIRLFREGETAWEENREERLVSSKTAQTLLSISDASVLGGTASSAFRQGRYRRLRFDVGGKTGTLTGSYPKGLTTWFAGVYPKKDPEVVVVSVTVLEELWQFRATNLAAEALLSYREWQSQRTSYVKTGSSTAQKN
ncbi:MAG: penicillin-binding transpeptidase domain-containing protein [Oligoflexus sp.]